MRLQSQLLRVLTFKETLHKNSWFYNLIQKSVEYEIHHLPLVKFMSDQIKNVVEAGQVYESKHLAALLNSMNASDRAQKEVAIFAGMIERQIEPEIEEGDEEADSG